MTDDVKEFSCEQETGRTPDPVGSARADSASEGQRSRTETKLTKLVCSTYDVPPRPANLVRWNVANEDICTCRCGKKGHAKAHPQLLTWIHNEVLNLKIIFRVTKEQIYEINYEKQPQKQARNIVYNQKHTTKMCAPQRNKVPYRLKKVGRN